MPTLNPHTRELSFKLVFYGPGLGGKTTTLKTLFASTKPENRGKLVSVATQQDRTLHFDFLPLRVPRVRGMTVRLQLYTVPGQLYYGATRKLLLSGVDGIVFVADSQEGRIEPNQESLDDLRQNLEELKRPLERIPHTFHWNKRDLPDAVPVDELERRFNPHGAPSLETIATSGEGVFEGLERITRLVLKAHEGDELDARPLLGIMDDAGGIAGVLKSMVDGPPRPSRPSDKPEAQGASPASSPTESPPPAVRVDGPPPEEPSSRLPSTVSVTEDLDLDPLPILPRPPPEPKAPFATTEGGTALSAKSPLEEDLPSAEPISEPPPVPSAPIGEAGPGFSFRALFSGSDSERRAVELAEAHLARSDAHAAILSCDVVLSRVFAAVGAHVGASPAPLEPAHVAFLLGLDGPRYAAFRGAVRAARRGEPVTLRHAFEAYLVVLEASRLRDRLRSPR